MTDIETRALDREPKKGAGELLNEASMHDWTPEIRARLAGLRLSPARP